MDRPWDDCKFFVTSGCRNAKCKFRHSEAAKKNPTCPSWASGQCKDIKCPQKHAIDIGATPCRFEFSSSGCTNSSCSFKHTLPRNTSVDSDLQEKLALFLAEHEKSKKENDEKIEKTDKSDSANEKSAPPSDGSNESDSECDLDALRAQALKTQVLKEKTQIIKRKGLSPKKDVLPAKIPKKEKVHIHRRLGERIQLQTTNDDNGPRRVIKSKSQYSEDEVSDLSLDELTDEEPEDLRATLNKNKQIIRISKPNSNTKPLKDAGNSTGRLIRKVDNTNNVKSPSKTGSPVKPDKIGSRVIRMKKEENKNDSRPSSSEWIERTISVKSKPENKILNRLVTGISQSESDYSDATQSDDSSKVTHNRNKPKRKPNLAWCNMTQNNSTEDDDLRKRSSDRDSDITYDPVDRPVEFTRKISVKGSLQSRLGSNVKSRLGSAQRDNGDRQSGEQSVKKRIGLPLKSRLGKESIGNRLGQRLGENKATTVLPATTQATTTSNTITTSSTTSSTTRRGNGDQTTEQPKKKKLILIKRKQPPNESSEVEPKKPKPSSPQPETTNEKQEQISNQKRAEQSDLIKADVKSVTPKIKKVSTKVSITDDLEDELLEGLEDDLELGNEIEDDDLFDL